MAFWYAEPRPFEPPVFRYDDSDEGHATGTARTVVGLIGVTLTLAADIAFTRAYVVLSRVAAESS